MTGAITWEQVLFFIGLLGTVAGVWWRIEGRVDRAKAEALKRADEAQNTAETAARDLAAYRTHVAETYTTKSGMKEIKDEILGAVSGIRDDVRHLATRIDGMHEAANKPRPAPRTRT